MTNAEAVQRQLQQITSARSETGVFVRMDDRFAVVNIGTATVTVPCIGFYPPVVGMAVRVDWVDGSPAVTGPVRPLSPLGVITAPGNPRATVEVDGEPYSLFYRDGYTPTVGDQVEINWTTGIIQGKITGTETPEVPEEDGGSSTPFELIVRAEASARIQGSGPWGNDDPWASSSNRGVWTYSNRVKDAIAGAYINSVDIYLPLVQEVGQCAIGVHEYGSVPGFFPDILFAMNLPLGSRNGWVRMPEWGPFLSTGQRGVGVYAPGGNGYSIWRGVSSDPLSGALRFNGVR